MEKSLTGKTVAMLVANGFEEVDMTEPQRALLEAGCQIRLVSPEQGLVNGWHGDAWGHYFPIDQILSSALAADFDALLVPGGSRGIAKLAQSPHTVRFLRGFVDGSKPMALIGDAISLLGVAERAAGRTVAAAGPEIRAPLAEAGVQITDDPIVIDNTLITVAAGSDEATVKRSVAEHFIEHLQDVPAAA